MSFAQICFWQCCQGTHDKGRPSPQLMLPSIAVNDTDTDIGNYPKDIQEWLRSAWISELGMMVMSMT
jgi:hypothetical protein